jgi:hypothetical protein
MFGHKAQEMRDMCLYRSDIRVHAYISLNSSNRYHYSIRIVTVSSFIMFYVYFFLCRLQPRDRLQKFVYSGTQRGLNNYIQCLIHLMFNLIWYSILFHVLSYSLFILIQCSVHSGFCSIQGPRFYVWSIVILSIVLLSRRIKFLTCINGYFYIFWLTSTVVQLSYLRVP